MSEYNEHVSSQINEMIDYQHPLLTNIMLTYTDTVTMTTMT